MKFLNKSNKLKRTSANFKLVAFFWLSSRGLIEFSSRKTRDSRYEVLRECGGEGGEVEREIGLLKFLKISVFDRKFSKGTRIVRIFFIFFCRMSTVENDSYFA